MDNKRNQPDIYKGRYIDKHSGGNLPAEHYPYEEINLSDNTHIKDYLDIIIRRKWILILAVLFCIITAGISTLLTKPIYKATAVIEIIPNPPKITSFDKERETSYSYWDTEEFYQTHYKLLKSQSFAKHIVNKLGMIPSSDLQRNEEVKEQKSFFTFIKISLSEIIGKDIVQDKENKGFDPVKETEARKEKEHGIASAFISGLNIIPDGKSRLTYLTYTSTDPNYASKSVNTIAEEYSRWTLERKHDSTKVAREFLVSQLDKSKANLEMAEEELAKFAKSVSVVSLDKDLNLVYKQLEEINEAYAQSETERLSKQALFSEIESGNYDYLPQVIQDESLQELLVVRTNLNSEYLNKSAIYGPNYPEMKQLKAQLGAVNEAIEKKKKDVAESLKKDYRAAVNKERLLKERAEEQGVRAGLLNEQAIQYKIIEREVNSNKSIYDELLQRLKETEITAAVAVTSINIVDYAITPKFPFKPNLKQNLLKALLLGLFLGCIIVFLLEHFDNALKSEEEIKNKLPLPFFGSIPLISYEESNEDMEKIVAHNPRSIVSEAFRVIRTSIIYSNPDNPPKSILVTSSQPFEGKTTAATNLALSLTENGKSVILIDADLRKPRIHTVFKNGNGKLNGYGLSEYLVGNAEIEDIIHNNETNGINIVTSGSIPPNPAELLGSNKMHKLVEDLMGMYDYVIMDGAPVIGFADSRLLSRNVDGVLLVTSIGITQKNNLNNVIEEIYKVGGNIIGTVVNRQSTSRGKYGYNYYYYYNDELGKDVKKIPKIRGPRA